MPTVQSSAGQSQGSTRQGQNVSKHGTASIGWETIWMRWLYCYGTKSPTLFSLYLLSEFKKAGWMLTIEVSQMFLAYVLLYPAITTTGNCMQ